MTFRTLFSTCLCIAFYAQAQAAEITAASAKIEPVPDLIWSFMQGKSYNTKLKGCAQREDLVLLTLPYWNYKNEAKIGHLIVHKSQGSTVKEIFVRLYTDKSYQFESMRLVDEFGGDDRASMNANNTSAYNCRLVAGSERLSSHAKGLAIDINPFVNPYVWKLGTSPPAATKFDTLKERKALKDHPGMILADSPIVKLFKAKGWGWGGEWKGSKDYQHFSADGR
jgi:hypothetical protein